MAANLYRMVWPQPGSPETGDTRFYNCTAAVVAIPVPDGRKFLVPGLEKSYRQAILVGLFVTKNPNSLPR